MVSNFIDTLETYYEHPDFRNSKKKFIAGDFNTNILKENSSNVINFLPTITKATRFPPCENENILPTTLDNIWNYTLNAFTSDIHYYDISDHCPTFINF